MIYMHHISVLKKLVLYCCHVSYHYYYYLSITSSGFFASSPSEYAALLLVRAAMVSNPKSVIIVIAAAAGRNTHTHQYKRNKERNDMSILLKCYSTSYSYYNSHHCISTVNPQMQPCQYNNNTNNNNNTNALQCTAHL